MISLEDAGAGEIDLTAIAVEPAWQARGVGRTLLRHVEQVARYAVAAGRTASVRLTVAEDNRRARGLFESVGYRLVPGKEDRYSGGQRSLVLRKTLQAGGEQSPDQDPNL
jgi:ribosomal protein S18 acetylase RimI-like enzyme